MNKLCSKRGEEVRERPGVRRGVQWLFTSLSGVKVTQPGSDGSPVVQVEWSSGGVNSCRGDVEERGGPGVFTVSCSSETNTGLDGLGGSGDRRSLPER